MVVERHRPGARRRLRRRARRSSASRSRRRPTARSTTRWSQTVRDHDPDGIPLPFMVPFATDAKHTAAAGRPDVRLLAAPPRPGRAIPRALPRRRRARRRRRPALGPAGPLRRRPPLLRLTDGSPRAPIRYPAPRDARGMRRRRFPAYGRRPMAARAARATIRIDGGTCVHHQRRHHDGQVRTPGLVRTPLRPPGRLRAARARGHDERDLDRRDGRPLTNAHGPPRVAARRDDRAGAANGVRPPPGLSAGAAATPRRRGSTVAASSQLVHRKIRRSVPAPLGIVIGRVVMAAVLGHLAPAAVLVAVLEAVAELQTASGPSSGLLSVCGRSFWHRGRVPVTPARGFP